MRAFVRGRPLGRRIDFPSPGGNSTKLRITIDAKSLHSFGAACDSAGNYWSTAILAGRPSCYSRTGKLLSTLTPSIPTPTMRCFAGDALFISSLSRWLDDAVLKRHPGIGGLYKMRAMDRNFKSHRS